MKKYNHFVDNEIGGTYGQANFGKLILQMAIALVIVTIGIILLK